MILYWCSAQELTGWPDEEGMSKDNNAWRTTLFYEKELNSSLTELVYRPDPRTGRGRTLPGEDRILRRPRSRSKEGNPERANPHLGRLWVPGKGPEGTGFIPSSVSREFVVISLKVMW